MLAGVECGVSPPETVRTDICVKIGVKALL